MEESSAELWSSAHRSSILQHKRSVCQSELRIKTLSGVWFLPEILMLLALSGSSLSSSTRRRCFHQRFFIALLQGTATNKMFIYFYFMVCIVSMLINVFETVLQIRGNQGLPISTAWEAGLAEEQATCLTNGVLPILRRAQRAGKSASTFPVHWYESVGSQIHSIYKLSTSARQFDYVVFTH